VFSQATLDLQKDLSVTLPTSANRDRGESPARGFCARDRTGDREEAGLVEVLTLKTPELGDRTGLELRRLAEVQNHREAEPDTAGG